MHTHDTRRTRRIAALGAGLAIAVSAVVVGGTAAEAVTTHDEFSLAGGVFVCPRATYTFVSGTIREVVHETTTPSGNSSFTVTETPNQVRMVDGLGNAYSMRGAIWFGGATNDETGAQIITATHHLEIINASGGVADTIRLVERIRDGELIARDSGTCLP